MRYISKLFLSLTFLSFALLILSLKANKGEGLSILKSNDGFLFVFNQPKESIMFEIPGKNFHEVETEELIFSIDNCILQFVLVPIKEFYNPNKSVDTLLQHFIFESNYIKSTYENKDIHFNKNFVFTSNGRKFLLWSFEPIISERDTSSNSVIKHIISSFSTPNFLLTISSPLTRNGNENEIYTKINHIISSIRYSSSFFDLESIQDSLKSRD